MKKCCSLADLILNVLIILSTVFAISAFFGMGHDLKVCGDCGGHGDVSHGRVFS